MLITHTYSVQILGLTIISLVRQCLHALHECMQDHLMLEVGCSQAEEKQSASD